MTQSENPLQDQAKLDQIAASWSRMIGNISHDIMSPLASVRLIGESLEEVFPELIKTYESNPTNTVITAQDPKKNSKNPNLNPKQLKTIEEKLIPNIQTAITNIINFLEILPFYNQKLIPQGASFSATKYLEELTKQSNFLTPEEKALVHLDFTEDFYLSCEPVFAESLLSNLIQNALAAIKQKGQGEIYCWIEKNTEHQKTLHIKDTSSGLEPSALARIFNKFFSKHQGKMTPGLGLCKLALLHAGQDIFCESTLGEYTDFLIR